MSNLILPGNAQPLQVLSGYTFSAGVNYDTSGTIPNQGATNFTPSGVGTVSIPEGYYDGSGVVEQVSVTASAVLSGNTIAGVAGTMPNQGSPTLTYTFGTYTFPTGYFSGGSVSITGLPEATVTVGTNPYGVGVNPSTNTIYVANEGSNTVSVIDGSTNAVTATVTVGTNPYDVGVNPSTNTIYVANEGSASVSVLTQAT